MTHSTPTTPDAHTAGTDLLQQVIAERTQWLTTMTRALAEQSWITGVVLAGSMGRGHADAFSDVDLLVAVDDTTPAEAFTDPIAGLDLPGTVLYRRPKPRNAPAGGGYLAVCLELAGLPLLVDLYLWPAATAAVPADATVLFERGRLSRSELGLLALLDTCPATDPTGSDPDDPATLLMLTQLAAKYHARGDQQRRASICRQLGIRDIDSIDELRQVLESRLPALRPAPPSALAAVGRLLGLVSVLKKEVLVHRNHTLVAITRPGAR